MLIIYLFHILYMIIQLSDIVADVIEWFFYFSE